jgi:hypothetical protein
MKLTDEELWGGRSREFVQRFPRQNARFFLTASYVLGRQAAGLSAGSFHRCDRHSKCKNAQLKLRACKPNLKGLENMEAHFENKCLKGAVSRIFLQVT